MLQVTALFLNKADDPLAATMLDEQANRLADYLKTEGPTEEGK